MAAKFHKKLLLHHIRDKFKKKKKKKKRKEIESRVLKERQRLH